MFKGATGGVACLLYSAAVHGALAYLASTSASGTPLSTTQAAWYDIGDDVRSNGVLLPGMETRSSVGILGNRGSVCK